MDKCTGCGKDIDLENDENVITQVQMASGDMTYRNFCGVACPQLGLNQPQESKA